MNLSALLLSAYDARSHSLWRRRIVEMTPAIRWQQLTLQPRNFNWRIRSNSLHWAFSNRNELIAPYDFLLATSMVDLSSLRGFIPQLAEIPNIIYFHENQFAYPNNKQKRKNIEPLLIPLYSALCADKIVFNSKYNQTTFIKGVKKLFNKLPDKTPDSIFEKLEDSIIIPVPISIPENRIAKHRPSDYLEVIWNHRWEYDKGPELLLAITKLIAAKSLPIRLHIVGERFHQSPIEFIEIQKYLRIQSDTMNMELGQFGYIEDADNYHRLLWDCDVVLSTALHDFQGLAIQEACLAGCTPLAPKALVYPEYLAEQFLYPFSDAIETSACAAVQRLIEWELLKQSEALPKVNLNRFNIKEIKKEYELLFGLAS